MLYSRGDDATRSTDGQPIDQLIHWRAIRNDLPKIRKEYIIIPLYFWLIVVDRHNNDEIKK
jgi:hypothetical protein